MSGLGVKPPWTRWRINPAHPLANSLRFYILCGNGQAVDLVTGRLATFSGTYGDGAMFPDGQAADIDGSDYFDFADEPSHNITGDITLVWRGVLDSNSTGTLCAKATSDAGFNSPFYFVLNSVPCVDFVRTNAGDFAFHRSSSSASTGVTTTLGATATAANANVTFYFDGVGEPTTGPLFGGGATTVTANTQPLRIGRDIAGTPKQLDGRVSVVMGWARILPASDMRLIHYDPYSLIARPVRDYDAQAAAAAAAFVRTVGHPQSLAGRGGLAA